jgi:hypothetical protein
LKSEEKMVVFWVSNAAPFSVSIPPLGTEIEAGIYMNELG